jgi:beta-xylosidase
MINRSWVSRCVVAAVVIIGMISALPASAALWVAEQEDGTYRNPILYADYSDPDVVRVGHDFYMTASSFNCVPGLPVLHSRDLVNWHIIGHAVDRLPPRFNMVQHGNGLWAPSIRFHDGYFWIFVGDPDWGILMTRAKDPTGPWEPLHVVREGKGLIDPCPLWDDDGKAYLVHALAKSRAGRNSILLAHEMSPDGRQLIGDEHLVIDGRDGVHPTIEGPKFYKRGDWYYIFAPAGGVKPGWQLAARAKHPFGPYEVRRVLEQGSTSINGPHQGGWVALDNGENWFVHFQDRGAYGRVVHLNPMRWVDGWPEMGVDLDKNGVGEPVVEYKKPEVGSDWSAEPFQCLEAFDGNVGLQWQWHGNPSADWGSLAARPGWLRLRSVEPEAGDLTTVANQLLQKFPAPSFTATTKLELASGDGDARAGLVVVGLKHAGILVTQDGDSLRIEQLSNEVEGPDGKDVVHGAVSGVDGPLWLRVDVESDAICRFSYSTNGRSFTKLGEPFKAGPGRWIGAKVGIICLGNSGHADFDSFRIE